MSYSFVLCLFCASSALLFCNVFSSSYFEGEGLFAVIDEYTAYPELYQPIKDSAPERYGGFKGVNELALDSTGNIYFSANLNDNVLYAGEVGETTSVYTNSAGKCIFKLNIADGAITHIAGTDCYYGRPIIVTRSAPATGALATEVMIDDISGIVVDSSENIYFRSNFDIWKIDGGDGSLSLFTSLSANGKIAIDNNEKP